MITMLTATFAEVMTTIGYVLIAILALMFMVVVHELGHYTAGKLLGFKILEFSIGFGPAIFKKRNKKTDEVFAIRPIPLGGYCQFEDEEKASDSPTAFNNQPPWKRIIVLFAGAFSNFLSAWIIITLFFTFYGQMLPTVASLYTDSANIGILQEGDVFLRVNGKQVNIMMAEDAANYFSSGDSAEVVVLRDGKRVKLTITKSNYVLGEYDEDGNFVPQTDETTGEVVMNYGYGFASMIKNVKLSFFRAFGRSFSFMFFMVYKILSILIQLVSCQIGMESAGGPITTIQVMSEASKGGFAILAYVVCLVSANLGVMNLLPLPALDGSKIVFCIIEWIFKKPVNRKVEAIIHTVGFVLLFGFAIFADVFHFIKSCG